MWGANKILVCQMRFELIKWDNGLQRFARKKDNLSGLPEQIAFLCLRIAHFRLSRSRLCGICVGDKNILVFFGQFFAEAVAVFLKGF